MLNFKRKFESGDKLEAVLDVRQLRKVLYTMFLIRNKIIYSQNLISTLRYLSASSIKRAKKLRHIDEVIPKNALGYPQLGDTQTANGKVYDSKPFRLLLQKDKLYSWCLCGHSKSQPLCDNTHKIAELEIKLKPIYFKVDETKEYWLCNCKQTLHRPFCDGSHIELQEKEKLENERKEKERLEREAEKET